MAIKLVGKPPKYWLVTRYGRGPGPSARPIQSRPAAEAEATRKATEHPGARFVVLEAICSIAIEVPKPVLEPMASP